MWISDPEALFTFVNKYWERFTGRTLGQEMGLNWIEGIHHDDLQKFFEEYKSSCALRKPFEIEYRFKTHDGSYRWVVNKGVPRFQTNGRFSGYIGSCTDINDQKAIEEKVKQFNEELKSLNASKDKFFSIIAHDLKSPLSGLLGFTEILFEEYDELQDEEIKEFIGHSFSCAKNLMALLENLLDWSRMQIGNISFSPTQLNVGVVVDEIFGLFFQNAKSKNIKLEKNIDIGITAFADKNMLTTILRNLVSNCIKFTNEGGVIEISAEVSENKVDVLVKDSGVGIAEDNLKKLFKIDSSFSTPGTNKERGTGLGLLLCNELAQKNKGKISVESELGKDTKFTLTLPIV
jgi:PAS domain S-box-containing protein